MRTWLGGVLRATCLVGSAFASTAYAANDTPLYVSVGEIARPRAGRIELVLIRGTRVEHEEVRDGL